MVKSLLRHQTSPLNQSISTLKTGLRREYCVFLGVILISACNPSQDKPPDRTLNPDDAEPMICTDDTLEQRRAYVASCVGQDCFEESVSLYCEEMK